MPSFARFWKPALAVAGIALVSMSGVAGAAAAGPFDTLGGSWSGRQYPARGWAHGRPQVQSLLFAAQRRRFHGPRGCASASNKIELRATLNSTGSRIAGNWEERTFNVGGSASGQANGNTIRLAIDAGVLAGSMSVVTNGQSQTISVRTDGAALKGVNINLRRD